MTTKAEMLSKVAASEKRLEDERKLYKDKWKQDELDRKAAEKAKQDKKDAEENALRKAAEIKRAEYVRRSQV